METHETNDVQMRAVLVLAIHISLAGCGSQRGEEGDSDGDADAGGQTDRGSCPDYVACVGATTPIGLGEALDTYGPEGSCWRSTSEVANLCASACESGLEQYRAAFPDELACDPGGIAQCREDADCPEDALYCSRVSHLCVF